MEQQASNPATVDQRIDRILACATDSNRPTQARQAAGEHGQPSWQRLTDKPAMRRFLVARERKRPARANVWLRCMRPDQMVSNERLLPNDS